MNKKFKIALFATVPALALSACSATKVAPPPGPSGPPTPVREDPCPRPDGLPCN